MSDKTPTAFTFHVSSYTLRVQKKQLFLLAALLLAVIAAWPLVSNPGFLNTRGGGDSPFLLQRLHQLETAVRDGHFPVRWMPDANYGYGYPFYNYYAPLSIYIAAFFRLIGFSFVGAIEATQVLGFIVAAWGAFKLATRWLGSSWAGLLTAVAYTFAPFHMVNIYVRGDSLAEFWAMAWYPWILLAADCLMQCVELQTKDDSGSLACQREIAVLGLTYAALILSHNISALIFSPFLLLYILLRWLLPTKKAAANKTSTFLGRVPHLLSPLLALLLAFALAAWFFVPALLEQDFAQLGPVTEGYFHYSNHFRGLNLVQLKLWFDYGVTGGNAFRMGLLQAITAVLGTIILITRKEIALTNRIFIPLALVISTFMLTPLSQILWRGLPLLSFTQFPWRFLSVQALPAALAAGALALLPWRRFTVPLLLVVLTLSGLAALRTDHLILNDADITAEKLAQYEWFSGNIGTTVSAEYLPPSVQPRPYSNAWLNGTPRDTVRALTGELVTASLQERHTDQQIWQVETAVSGATLLFPTLAWPGWSATIDDKPASLIPALGSGLLQLDVPAGIHTIRLQLQRTSNRLLMELLSLAALIIALWFWQPRPNLKWAWLGIGVFLLMITAALWPQQTLTQDDLTWDFAQMGYLHHDVDGVTFENGAVLENYTYSQETINAGTTMTITMNWQAGLDSPATLALTTPAAAWSAIQPSPAPIASQTIPTLQSSTVFNLEIPANAPPGLVIPRLTVAGSQALMPSGQTRGDLYLRPFHIQNNLPANSDLILDVRAVEVTAHDPHTLDIQLAWHTDKVLSQNYKVSLRLSDANGQLIAQQDTQPGFGFQPSSGWPARSWVNDWLALTLPDLLPTAAPYSLAAHLYRVDSGEVILTRLLGEITPDIDAVTFDPHMPVFDLPADVVEETAVYQTNSTPLIQLRGHQSTQTPETVTITLYWEALTDIPGGYTRFIHIVDAGSGEIVTQVDSIPHFNSYPTSQWLPGEIVGDTITIDRSQITSDNYIVVVGFYERVGDGFVRLTAVAPDGSQFADGRVPLTE